MSYNDSRIRKIKWKKRISHLSIYFRISIVSVDKLGYPQKKSTMSHIRTSVPQDVLCQYVDNVFKRACAICKIYIIHWFKIFEWFESIFIVKSLSRNVKRFKNIKQNEFNLNIEIDKIKTKYSKFYQLDYETFAVCPIKIRAQQWFLHLKKRSSLTMEVTSYRTDSGFISVSLSSIITKTVIVVAPFITNDAEL